MKKINLGIIGISDGNGHPYSWSAIFNGYQKDLMERCGFPVIPRYLEKQKFPDDSIKEAFVSHIWTQSKETSKKIADTCFIKNVVNNFDDMIGQIDGVLLARDDAANHLTFAKPFIESSIPIYIDKPLALSKEEALKILRLRKFESQIFTCSALRYAREFLPSHSDIHKLGKIKKIEGKIAKEWDKYSIHIIEPILNLIPNRGPLISFKRKGDIIYRNLDLKFQNIDSVKISTLGPSKINPTILIHGEKDSLEMEFKDSFNAFKTALNKFIGSIIDKESEINYQNLLEIINIIELGNIQ